MIVCVCNAKNCQTVRATLADAPHVDTPAALHRAMGTKPQCGRCLPSLAELIARQIADETLAALMAAAD